ncbi:fimbrillin family protein [Bacteroides fluxus]|uniref:fimbrillin family protein n=2 Tax=Bacteroides fluxus TaxID=626930 RepID=UPI0023F4CED1|nr:fimbrillin family protein [Bacteroides fluxus]
MIQTMNRKYFRMASVAALLALAACSQDELAESAGTLPEGKYPLEIGSVTLAAEVDGQPWSTDAPQTRVSENTDGNSSRFDWNGSEQIGVQLYTDGEAATYTLNQDKTLTPVNGTLYWKNKEAATVMAWYPVAGTVSLADQSQGLAYVLKSSGTGKYDTPVTLNFSHALSKIRVKLEGDKATDVTKVSIESYTSCTNTNGTVSTEGASTGEIVMHKADGNIYEANVVPNQEITKFKVNDGEWVNLTVPVTPIAGSYHIITINAERKDFTVTGDYTVEGNHKPLIIASSGTVTFKNARITSNDRYLIHIQDGYTPTLVFDGTNVLKSEWNYGNKSGIFSGENDEYSIQLQDGAKLAVIGNGCTPIGYTYSRSKLKISGNGEMWVQSNLQGRAAITLMNGSLTVSDGVKLTAVGPTTMYITFFYDFVPAIGLSVYTNAGGGEITLSDCTLNLYAHKEGGKEPENWVTLNNGTVTPDVDGALKVAAWDTEVSLSNNVKVKKLKQRPEPPAWAQ